MIVTVDVITDTQFKKLRNSGLEDFVKKYGVTVTDQDGQGLDHNATFAYDPAGRLTDSTVGSADQQFEFSFRYDALQNMTFRGVTGPQDIGVLVGRDRYGERGYGPRQLTSVVPGGSP